ncbi:Uu.00g114420.m01.CDS01 [Anthostomella pinea]|uniref:Uu.00g114420.m01.CDS01 n=1 Tax=Anthostomella pinea TaxID=933095 RepID=A0AAI8YE82_9PEZI|nr:Uu.00g114420.m01.CDS01 [Anthostomella pinea]
MSYANGTSIRFKDCTPEICPYEHSYYDYRIWLVPNVIFAAIFGVSLVAYISTYIRTRRSGVFTIAIVLGLVVEIDGYVGRILSWNNQWSSTAFIMQVTSLTFAPAFLAAGIYVCLRKIVSAVGPENSRIRPELYTRIFIPCDIICLFTQSIGGTFSAIAASKHKDTNVADKVIIVGLALQVVTLFAFIAVATDFGIRTMLRRQHLGSAALDQNPAMVAVRGSWLFKGFIAALTVSTIAIFIRCVFRLVELSGGYHGPITARQDLFVAFEGVMLSVAVLVLNVFHPSLCFGPALDADLHLARKASINSDKNVLMGTSLGPDFYDAPPKLSSSTSFDEGTRVGQNPYARYGGYRGADRMGRAV